ncbi:hypothetical protein HNP52_004049 [Sphingomonas kyeonggiensis]|uniref:Uncharacterized protein n=1 Tax=Sphingomonas kyeonggiensis TaxID=1268553 RepID=A0A7W7K4L2_9SPHN|nr:hypothetical protein [Sphingomonas kyeonggiensis]MBB4840952.1 hypothetical protein [Sphingomonas kyeonggiensis]
MRIRAYAMFMLAALMLPAPASAQQPVTKAELRQQDPSITDAQLRDQLWGLFRKADRRSPTQPTQPLMDERFVTTPYPDGAFGTSGLCRMDVVVMKLAPTQGLLRDADATTPMRAYGLESGTRFLVLPLLPEERGDVFDDKWNGPCARLGQDDPRFFRAVSGEVARKGHALLQRAATAVRAGSLAHCDAAAGSCVEALAAFVARPFESVQDCATEEGATCYRFVGKDDVQARIWQVSGGPLQVEITKLIVLRHPRPD